MIGFSYGVGKERRRQPSLTKTEPPDASPRNAPRAHGAKTSRRGNESMSPRRYRAKLPKSAVTQTRTEAWGGHRWATCENAPQSGKSPRALRFAPPRPYCGICRRIASTYAAPYTERCVPLRVTSPTSIYSSISSGTEIIDAPLSSALITPEHTV